MPITLDTGWYSTKIKGQVKENDATWWIMGKHDYTVYSEYIPAEKREELNVNNEEM